MSSCTHKAIVTTAKGIIGEIQLPTPEPEELEVLVEAKYSSLVAFDAYTVDSGVALENYPLPLGLNAAGTVAKVGANVDNLKVGDRVTTFALADEFKGKSMQTYALLKKYSVAKIPDTLASQEAATIPDNLVTSYFVLFDSLRLPIPSSLPASSPPPRE
ncbi:chaperonin 10-like protein [Hysterangium stoloniferum]|nr:chaperonin 10-like protein [Hysterangium stoloniferum]